MKTCSWHLYSGLIELLHNVIIIMSMVITFEHLDGQCLDDCSCGKCKKATRGFLNRPVKEWVEDTYSTASDLTHWTFTSVSQALFGFFGNTLLLLAWNLSQAWTKNNTCSIYQELKYYSGAKLQKQLLTFPLFRAKWLETRGNSDYFSSQFWWHHELSQMRICVIFKYLLRNQFLRALGLLLNVRFHLYKKEKRRSLMYITTLPYTYVRAMALYPSVFINMSKLTSDTHFLHEPCMTTVPRMPPAAELEDVLQVCW